MKFYSIIFSILFLAACKESSENKTPETVPASETQVVEDTPSQVPYTDISVDEARELIKTQADIQIIDVRTPEETKEGVIEGAILADINNQDFPTQMEKLDPAKSYIVYCAVGGRSKTAAGFLQSKGFKKVYNMVGGYKAWTANQ